jgi:ATP-binding cassette, subfamily C, bacterial
MLVTFTESSSAELRLGRCRTPSILQMESAECGAAALAILLAYYGRVVPLALLRRECGVSRDGSKASNILRAAALHGLQAKAFRKDFLGLGSVGYPYIVFWNFNHFVVVEGYRNGKVFLNDPASGHRRVTGQEFADAYAGIVLAMEPGPEFKRAGHKPSVLSGLWVRLRGSASAFVVCAFTAMLLVVPGVVYPVLLQTFIDKVLVQELSGWAGPVIIGILLTALTRAVLTQIQGGMLRRLQVRLSTVNSTRFIWHLLHIPSSYYAQRYAGEVSGRVELNDSVGEILSGRLASALIDALMMAFYLVVMFRFDRTLTGIGLVFVPLSFVILRWVGSKRVDVNNRLAHFAGKSAGVAMSGLQAIRTIKASALESDFFEKWAGHFAKLMNARQEVERLNQVFATLPILSAGIMTMLVLAIGVLRVMDGALTIGQLVAFQALMNSFLLPVNNLISLGFVVQTLETDLARLDDVLGNPAMPEALSLIKDPDCWSGTCRLSGFVELRNVSFGYQLFGAPLIENLSLSIGPGQRVAVVGASGSGKSTLIRLIAGLYEAGSGEILFDGHPRTAIPREVLSNSLAVVEQDISLFEGSLADNITLWDTTIPPHAVVQACEDALIHDAITAMPGGYNSELMEGAVNLSGGQRQRLELARALASNPSILLLDEATSALDAETEHRIDRNLRRRGCACLIAAHRLSTIRDCEEIIVLDRGRAVERGTHEKLLQARGEYARLLAAEAELEAPV